MAKLITHHDKFHIHKILGLLALLHYIYRFALLFNYGSAFPTNESASYASLGVLLHGFLSWSSLLLPLPTKRNFTKPMIWPEFRLHSLTFATRHVVATILTLLNLWPDEKNYVYQALARGALVLGAVKAAALITDRHGDRELRTTNSMPYPKTVSPEQRPTIKKNYALAQFAATAVCFLPDASLNFAPLLAIQMAPLMMTLVRKGKVSSGTYHRVYALSLYLGYAMVFTRLLATDDIAMLSKSVRLKAAFLFVFPSSKLRKIMSPPMVWTVNVLLSTILYPLVMEQWVNAVISEEIARRLFWLMTLGGTARQAMEYAPLFGITRLYFSYSVGKQLATNDTTDCKRIQDDMKAELS